MLISFKAKNFQSIGEEQEISFKINNKDVLDNSSVKLDKNPAALNLVACIVGHNASGKTTILKALSFFSWWVNSSYDRNRTSDLPIKPHKLREQEDSEFSIEFIEKGELYKYSATLNQKKVVSEYFGQHFDKGFTYIFKYERQKDGWLFFKHKLGEINSSDLKRFERLDKTSILSSLIQTGYLSNLTFFENIQFNVDQYGYHPYDIFSEYLDSSEKLYESHTLRKNVLSFIKNIDIGISDFTFSKAIIRDVKDPEDEQKKEVLKCLHSSTKGEFELTLIEESNGTRHSINLLSYIYPALSQGGIILLDEIESGIHPFVVRKIINLFESKSVNTKNAQILFTTQQHTLLNDRTKTQIFLTEKDNTSFETEVYRLDEISGIRNDENYFQKYITGTYGAMPNFNWHIEA